MHNILYVKCLCIICKQRINCPALTVSQEVDGQHGTRNVQHYTAWCKREGGSRRTTWVKNTLQRAGVVNSERAFRTHQDRLVREGATDMSTIELVNPVVPEGPPPANLRMAQRQPLGPGARITLIDNGKPRARAPSGVVKRRHTTRGLCHCGRRSGRTTAKRVEPRRRGGLIPDRPRLSGIQ